MFVIARSFLFSNFWVPVELALEIYMFPGSHGELEAEIYDNMNTVSPTHNSLLASVKKVANFAYCSLQFYSMACLFYPLSLSGKG
jgi:hypothetical protein